MPDPYFTTLTKKYDVDNKENLLKRRVSSGEIHVSEIKPPEVDSFWNTLTADLTPELTPQVTNKIHTYNQNMKSLSFQSNWQAQEDQLEDIQSGLVKHYLEKRLLNGFIIKRIKESSSGLASVEDRVRSLSGQETPTTKNSTKVKVASDEKSWHVDMGTRTDWIRQKSRAWFNCDLFNSEARVDAAGLSRLNYEVKLSKSLVVDDINRPFSIFHTAFVLNNKETSSLFKTNLTRRLELNYQSVFSRNDQIVQVNYNLEF